MKYASEDLKYKGSMKQSLNIKQLKQWKCLDFKYQDSFFLNANLVDNKTPLKICHEKKNR